MYTSLFFMGMGWLLLMANWFVGGPLIAGILLIIVMRVKKEDAMLIEEFGDGYRAYMERSGRFFPNI